MSLTLTNNTSLFTLQIKRLLTLHTLPFSQEGEKGHMSVVPNVFT